MDAMFEFLMSVFGARPILSGIVGVAILVWLYFDIKRRKEWHAGRKDRMRLLKEEALEKIQAEKTAAQDSK